MKHIQYYPEQEETTVDTVVEPFSDFLQEIDKLPAEESEETPEVIAAKAKEAEDKAIADKQDLWAEKTEGELEKPAEPAKIKLTIKDVFHKAGVTDFDIAEGEDEEAKVTEWLPKLEEIIGKKAVEKHQELKIADLPPDTQQLFRFLTNADPAEATVENFQNITAHLDQYIVMGNEELMRAEYKERGLKPENIDAKIEAITADGTLDAESETIRNGLLKNREAVIEADITKKETARKEYAEKQVAKYNAETDVIVGALKGTKQVFGVDIPEKALDIATPEQVKAFREQTQKDPKMWAEFMLFSKKKPAIEKAMIEKVRTEYLKGKEVHNISLGTRNANHSADGSVFSEFIKEIGI